MHCTCVRQTELPNTTRLLADILYHPDRTAPFYRHPLRDLKPFRPPRPKSNSPATSARPWWRRCASRTAQPRSPAPGPARYGRGRDRPAGGPLFRTRLHHLQGAARGTPGRMAHRQRISGGAGVLAGHRRSRFRRGEPRLGLRRRPPARQSWKCGAPPLRSRWARSHLPLRPSRELRDARCTVCPSARKWPTLVEETYRAGSTMGKAFGELLRELLPVSTFCRWTRCCRRSANSPRPLSRRAVEAAPELNRSILGRNRELAAAGYHAQVHVEAQTSLVFLLENGKRLALRRNGDEYRAERPPLYPAELWTAPRRFLPTPCCVRSCRIPCCPPWHTSWPGRSGLSGADRAAV